jgi:3-carboxy-cis,cis-muconate cycloisomerase
MPFANIPVATTVVDSILFRDAFGTPAMRAVFCDHALIERYVEVEIALARAEGRTGVIPAAAAEEIAARTKPADFDFDHLRHETEIVGYPILPVVHQMANQVRRRRRLRSLGCHHAGHHGHGERPPGARRPRTSSAADIEELRRILGDLAKRYRDTPMAGRTHLQQALPITFGYKAAIWRAMFDRHAERLAQLRPRVEVVEFAGAAGHARVARRPRPRRARRSLPTS